MELNILRKVFLLVLSLFISFNCWSQETLNIPKHRIGVTIRAEHVKKDFFYKSNVPFNPSAGLGIEMGSFYERKLGKRFVLSTELNLRYREFIINHFNRGDKNGIGYDYRLNFFEFDWKLLTLSPSIGLKMYVYKKPKIYIEIGGGYDYRLNAAPPSEYLTSTLYNEGQVVRMEYIPGTILNGQLVILQSKIYSRLELGLGIEIGKIDMGLFYRREVSESIGLRIKYSLLEK